MPSIALRAQNAYSSPIRKLSPFADKAKQAGRHVYHLNIGQPDIMTPPAALKRLNETPINVLSYSPSAGFMSYRQKLASYYEKVGIHVTPEQIHVTTGGSEALLLTYMACLDPGQTILTPEPYYANYLGFAQMAGLHVKNVRSVIDDGYALPSVEEFRKAITPETKAIALCNPNNPTGTIYPQAMLEALGQLALEHDLFLFVDEVYREFCYSDTPVFSALNLKGLEQNVVVIDSVSKRYSACGARVGMVISRNPTVISSVLRYAEARLSPPSLGQMLGEYMVDTDQKYFDDVRAEYVRRRDYLVDRLQAMPGVVCPRPDGAFYVFARLPIDNSDRFCRWLLEDFSHNNSTVMLAPGAGFYATPGLGLDEVRLAYVLNIDDLKKAMDVLEAALAQYPGKTA
jgi:aspartate aminotransferase